MRKLIVPSWIVSSSLACLMLSGCQQLGFKQSLTANISDEDDWGISPPASQVPRPYIDTKRSRANGSNAAYRVNLNDQAANQLATSEVPANAATKTTQDAPKTEPKKLASLQPLPGDRSRGSDVVETGVEGIDIDAALDGLPIQYQEILKKQLIAANRYQSTDAKKEANSIDAESHGGHISDRESSDKFNSTPQPLVSEASTTSGSSTKNKVVIRLSDQDDLSQSANGNGKDVALASDERPVGSSPSVVSPAVSNQANDGVPSATTAVSSSATTTAQAVPTPLPPASRQETVLPTQSTGQATNNVQVANPTTATWHQSVTQAISVLEKQLKEQPAADENLRLHQELTLRLLYASLRKSDEAMQPINGLSDDENEYYRNQMLAMIEASNPDAMPVRSRHLSVVMNAQRKATGHLAAASNLEVRGMAFCTDVERYGVLTKFPRYQFKPDDEVLLYCEIENVSATPVREGYESQLQGSYEILDAQGNRIVEQTLPMEPDICQNVRRDYYMVYRIFMPQQIASGNYRLRLTIEDVKARKYGQSTLDLQIKK